VVTNETLIAATITILLAATALKNKTLNPNGTITAIIIATITYLTGGTPAFIALITFFIIAETATKHARTKTKQKHETRTTSHVLGNAGAGIITLILGHPSGFYGSTATALSDTLSAELGMRYGKKTTLITTLKPTKAGTDGGITTQGTIAGITGAIIIATIYYLLINQTTTAFLIITIAGTIGTITDSILGAIFERKGKLTNTQVNFLATLTGAITAITLTTIMH
jgi:uncharacterized protein (TIGR00297 family)